MRLIGRLKAAVYEKQFAGNRDANLFRGVFESAESAVNTVPRAGKVGYDNEESAALYDYHLVRVFAHDYPALYWLGRCFAEGLRTVVDLGGHVGIKYYAFGRYLDYPAGLRWHVCDVPSVVNRGKEIASTRDRAGSIDFCSSPGDAAASDVLFASGSLQYLPYGVKDLLETLAESPKRIIINTTPLHPRLSFFTLNSIGAAFCPYRVVSEPELVGTLASKGYKVVDRWECPGKPMIIPGFPEHSLDHYCGLYLEKGAG